MSVSPPPMPRSPYAESSRAVPRPRRSGRPAWPVMAAVVAILAASGGLRLWQQGRVERDQAGGRSSPFPLALLPLRIGTWQGQDADMDPRLVRATGSTDLIARRYVDGLTGVALDVIVLYGPEAEVGIHTPEVCYPSAGYEALPGAFDRPIAAGGSAPRVAPFRSLAFSRGTGGLRDAQEVYCGFRGEGGWSAVPAGPKASRRSPGLFKVQVSRRVGARERRDVGNPCEPFLAALVGEIEARLAGSRAGPPTS